MEKINQLKVFSGLIHLFLVSTAFAITLFQEEWGELDFYIVLIIFYTPLPIILALFGNTILNPFRKGYFLLRLFVIIMTSGILSFSIIWCQSFIIGMWIAQEGYFLYISIIGSMLQLLFLESRLSKTTKDPEN